LPANSLELQELKYTGTDPDACRRSTGKIKSRQLCSMAAL
jgi:hypothetical protein